MAAKPLRKSTEPQAFITGSHAYGKPHDRSDVDLVIFCDEETEKLLLKEFPPDSHKDFAHVSADNSIRIGKLNLITCTTEKDYSIWVQGTKDLKKKAPIKDKSVAIEHFHQLRKKSR